MTIEEKAKAYDEAIKKAKEEYNDELNSANAKESIERIFPELKESEEERIRKALISAINNICAGDEGLVTFNGFSKEQVQSWLEKQSEQKPIDKCEGCNNVEGCVACVDGSEWAHIEEQKPFYHENANIQQKNFASIEPKFKVGDWVVFNNKHQSIYQVEKIEDGYYILRHTHGGTFRVCVLHDESLRLWSIEDAKDSDLLVCVGKYGQEIGVVKEYVGKYGGCDKCFETYCFVDWDGIFRTGEYMGSKEIHPATREQRDKFEKVMEDAGFIFDFNKKELKKIEHDVQLTEFEEAVKDLMNDYRDAIGDNDATIEEVKEHAAYMLSLIHQNPAWSEDDEEKFSFIRAILIDAKSPNNCASNSTYYREVTESIEWLKSLKERYTWKPSDEQMKALNEALYHVDDSIATQIAKLIGELKKLREE